MNVVKMDLNPAEMPQLRHLAPDLLRVSIEFAISCPRCGNHGDKINPSDKKDRTGRNRPTFRCKRCDAEINPETSSFSRDLQAIIADAYLTTRFERGVSQQATAALLGLSQPTASRLEAQLLELFSHPKRHLEWSKQLSPQPDHVKTEGKPWDLVYFIDETWERAKGKKWNVIQVVDQPLQPVAIKVSPTRTADDIKDVILESYHVKGIPDVIVADAYIATAAALDELHFEGLFIQHVHATPRGRITLSRWEPLGNCGCRARWIIGARSSLAQREGERFYYFMYHLNRCATHQCLCRAELCRQDDHHPLCEPCRVSPQVVRWEQSWKGTRISDVFKKGLPFTVIQQGVRAPPEVMGEGLTVFPPALQEFVRPRLAMLLCHAWKLFRGKCITSNVVESTHSYLHPLLQSRGPRDAGKWQDVATLWKMLRTRPQWVRQQLRRLVRRASRTLFQCGLARLLQHVLLAITFRYSAG